MSRGWNGKDGVVGKDKRDGEERPEGEATVLPAREAISLITSDQSAGFTSDIDDEELTSEDRNEHSSNSDPASSQT